MTRKTMTVAKGKRVIAPIAPDFCHSRLSRVGASSTASIARFESKSLTRAVMSTEPDWKRVVPSRFNFEKRSSRVIFEGFFEGFS